MYCPNCYRYNPDERLRRLEREAIASGNIQAHARLLLERVRVGDLDAHYLDLVSYLGYPAAKLAIEEPQIEETAEDRYRAAQAQTADGIEDDREQTELMRDTNLIGSIEGRSELVTVVRYGDLPITMLIPFLLDIAEHALLLISPANRVRFEVVINEARDWAEGGALNPEFFRSLDAQLGRYGFVSAQTYGHSARTTNFRRTIRNSMALALLNRDVGEVSQSTLRTLVDWSSSYSFLIAINQAVRAWPDRQVESNWQLKDFE